MIKLYHLFKFILILHFFIRSFQSKPFQKCSDLPYCTRNINLEKRQDSFHILKESISFNNSKIKMILQPSKPSENQKNVLLKIYILKDGFFRVKIKDVDNKRFHFNKKDDIFNMKKMNKNKNFKVVTSDNNLSIYYHEKFTEIPITQSDNEKNIFRYEIDINFYPFKINYLLEHKSLIEINSRNLLNMEFPNENYIKQEQEAQSSVKLDIKFNDCMFIWGLPERNGDVQVTDTVGKFDAYRLFNVDSFLFEKDQFFGLYGTIPFLLGSQKGGEIYSGFIWNNPSETYVRVKSEDGDKVTLWISESGIIDFSFWADANSISSFYYKFHKYIEFTDLPLGSALGYHQSRWNYKHTKDLKIVDRLFDKNDIPYDYIWLDIEHTDGKRYMTWDKKFDGVEEFIKELEQKKRNLVVIIDPHIKSDSGYSIYNEAVKNQFYIYDAPRDNQISKNPFEGICWCEDAIYLNFYDEAVRNFWKNQIINSQFFFNFNNIFIWNDMNEPSVFKQVDMTLPRRSLFKYNEKFYEHRDAHNAYGYLMHKSSYEALKLKYKKRPFVLTRSFYLGSHIYGAVWTGDTRSSFTDLGQTIPMILSMSISGFSFVGGDVGGFHGEIDPHLLCRWYQIGVFYPFFRAHSHNESSRREPWLYDEETLSIIKHSIITRYMLLPYIYLTFFQHFKTGMPVTRPIWFYYKDILSLETYSEKQFFFGDAIMIRPVIKENEHFKNVIDTYLPDEERWYDFYDMNEYIQKGERNIEISKTKIGIFIRGGFIVPMKWRIRRSSLLLKNDPYTLIIALNSDHYASGMIYLDDEESYDYKEGNKYALKKFIFNKNELSITTINDEFKVKNKIERILILGLNKKVEEITYISQPNKEIKLEFEIKKENILEIKRFQFPIFKLWKIKFKVAETT